MSEVAVHVRIEGRVQGVWFRAWTEKTVELKVASRLLDVHECGLPCRRWRHNDTREAPDICSPMWRATPCFQLLAHQLFERWHPRPNGLANTAREACAQELSVGRCNKEHISHNPRRHIRACNHAMTSTGPKFTFSGYSHAKRMASQAGR